MPRVGTTNLNLGTWLQGERPGAGSQTVDNTGLNGNWIKIDTALGTQHNADGTHKTAVIDGANLKSTCVDGSTLEQDATTKKLRIKDGGVTGAKLNSNVVDDTEGLEIASNKIRIQSSGVRASHLNSNVVDGSTLEQDATTKKLRIKDNGITGAKISHDNTRTKVNIVFAIPTGTAPQYAYVNNVQTSATLGVPMPRSGSITKMSICLNNGVTQELAFNYGVKTFSAGDRITIYHTNADGSSPAISIYKNGVVISGTLLYMASDSRPAIVNLEIEYD